MPAIALPALPPPRTTPAPAPRLPVPLRRCSNTATAMKKQMIAERARRSEFIHAEGNKAAMRLKSEGQKIVKANMGVAEQEATRKRSEGEAAAKVELARAERASLETISEAVEADECSQTDFMISKRYNDLLRSVPASVSNARTHTAASPPCLRTGGARRVALTNGALPSLPPAIPACSLRHWCMPLHVYARCRWTRRSMSPTRSPRCRASSGTSPRSTAARAPRALPLLLLRRQHRQPRRQVAGAQGVVGRAPLLEALLPAAASPRAARRPLRAGAGAARRSLSWTERLVVLAELMAGLIMMARAREKARSGSIALHLVLIANATLC